MPADLAAGFTTADLARRWRIGEDKIRAMVRSGELVGINTASTPCGKPRFVFTADQVAAFEKRRSTAPAPKPARQKRKTEDVDFYPD